LEDPGIGGGVNIKMDLQEVALGAWIGLIWLKIGTADGLL